MIKYIKNFLFGKPVSNLPELALDALREKLDLKNVEVQNLHAFVYDPLVYNQVANELMNYKNLDQIKNLTIQDLRVDCVQLVLVSDVKSSYIVSIFDPYDPFQEEYVMDIFKVK